MEYLKISETSTEKSMIRLDLEFRYMKAFEIYDHFVDPELLRRWWVPQVDKIDFRSGGEYQFTWTKTQRRIWGKYSDNLIGGKYLEFSWHDTLSPEIMPKSVKLTLENVFKDDAVCFATLNHSLFTSSSDDQDYRSTILSQWITLFRQLANQWGER